MPNTTDPNFGCVGGANGFEEWACDDFNLLEYVGQDNSPFDKPFGHDDFDTNDDDDSLRKKDMIYSTWQINNVLLPPDQNPEQYVELPYYDNNNGIVMQPQNTLPMEEKLMLQKNNPMVPSTSKSTSAVAQKLVKLEPEHHSEFPQSNFNGVFEYDDHVPNYDTSSNPDSVYASKMKPRKYRIKPDSEKRNPHYRAKREKNNDAVRKSRDKAKRVQEEKEERLHYLEGENIKQSKLIDQLRTRNQFLETQLINMKRTCTCQRLPIR